MYTCKTKAPFFDREERERETVPRNTPNPLTWWALLIRIKKNFVRDGHPRSRLRKLLDLFSICIILSHNPSRPRPSRLEEDHLESRLIWDSRWCHSSLQFVSRLTKIDNRGNECDFATRPIEKCKGLTAKAITSIDDKRLDEMHSSTQRGNTVLDPFRLTPFRGPHFESRFRISRQHPGCNSDRFWFRNCDDETERERESFLVSFQRVRLFLIKN